MPKVRKILPIIVAGLVFFFMFRNLHRNWQRVTSYEWSINYWALSFSVIGVLLGFLCVVVAWRLILGTFGGKLSFGKAWRIFFLSALGRYLPGKIWQMLGMVYLCGKEGVSTDRAASSAIVAQILSVVSGLVIGFLAFGPIFGLVGSWSYVLLLIIPAGFVVVSPPVMRKVAVVLSKRLGKEPILSQMGFKDVVIFFALYCLNWIAYGGAFFLFVNSIAPLSGSASRLLSFTGIFAGAYVLGLLAVFVPGGLGVREGVMAFLLGRFFPLPIATAISIASRIWFTSAELIGLALSIKLR